MTRHVPIQERQKETASLQDWQRVLIDDCEQTMRTMDAEEVQQRFAEIREYFLDYLKDFGQPRAELYFRPKPGDAREPTEEELVRRWAQIVNVPLEQIRIGILQAFMEAAGKGQRIVTFRDCVPHIRARADEWRDGATG
jgi:hypothetical protein